MATPQIDKLRNIAIIAHVDHGKTTLVDKLLQQSGTLESRGEAEERVMDSNDIEKERGITILAKNTAIDWNDYRINIVDTPGHADFGGEVERIMSMVDSVLLIVDAVDGPMPQTRFVTQKAFAHGLKPIVVINKIDRPGARPDWVMDQVFDLFDNLGASDEQLDFKVVYASALNGWASLEEGETGENMEPLFETIVGEVAAPEVDLDGPLQMQISQLDYSSYVGVIGVGRVTRGSVKPNQQVTVVGADGKTRNGKVGKVLGHLGLERIDSTLAEAGDIIAITTPQAHFSSRMAGANKTVTSTGISISGTDAKVSTLLITVGLPNKPSSAGSGGLARTTPRFPSRDSSIAVSSPHTYEPAPARTFNSKSPNFGAAISMAFLAFCSTINIDNPSSFNFLIVLNNSFCNKGLNPKEGSSNNNKEGFCINDVIKSVPYVNFGSSFSSTEKFFTTERWRRHFQSPSPN